MRRVAHRRIQRQNLVALAGRRTMIPAFRNPLHRVIVSPVMERKIAATARGPNMKHNARRQFEAWASTYDRSILNYFIFQPAYVTLMEEIARWYSEHNRPFRLLDVGCGTGTLLKMLAATHWPIRGVGLDYAATMAAAAADKASAAGLDGRTGFVNADSEHIPFADESFDLITCSNSFHHYPHQQNVVHEMHRLLSPGGRVILIDGFRDCVIGWVVFDVIVDRIEGNVHHAPWRVVDEYFRTAGFGNIRRRKFNFLFPMLTTIGDK